MVADEVDYVLGVDTHRDKHMLAAVTAPTGAVVAGEEVSADARAIARHSVSRHAARPAGACGRSRAAAATGPASRVI